MSKNRVKQRGVTVVLLVLSVGVARAERNSANAFFESARFPLWESASAQDGPNGVERKASVDTGFQGVQIAQSSGVKEPSGEERGGSRADAETPAPNPGAAATADITKSQNVPPDPNAYIIGEQDSLVVTVWKERELSGGVVVRPDGKITVPLVGEIKAVGMTPVQLQTILAEKLKPFVTVPQVTVAVSEIRSRKVYLIGHTAREGPFTINSSTTVLQIIAQAGGLKDFAKRNKIYILRQNGKEQVRFSFNYNDVIRGKHIEQNILLEPGDTVVVP